MDSVQPEITSIPKKKKKKKKKKNKGCCTTFSCLGRPNSPTEREQIAYDFLCRWTPSKINVDTNLPLHVKKIPFVLIRLS